jgi:protein ImuB
VICPDWPVVAAGIPAGEPVVVIHANRVLAASPAARDDGVVVGLRRREAQSRSPSAVVLDHDPARDARAFEPVLHALESITPWLEIDVPGACAFATRGPSRYHGGDEALAADVAATVEMVLGEGRLAVAGHPGVGIADGRFTAEMAAEKSVVGAGRPIVVPLGSSRSFLAPLSVTALGDREPVGLLARLGITSLGMLAALPAADVLARFGEPGRFVHRLAAGEDDRPPVGRHLRPDLAVEMEIDPPAPDAGPVAFAGRHLAVELHERLAAAALACTSLVVTAETEHGERHERCWHHDLGLSTAAIAERVRWQLEGWASGPAPPTGAITLLRFTPDEVVGDNGRQLGFWGGRSQADERAGRAMARLSGLLGPESVRVPEWRGGRSPGEQLVLVPAETAELEGEARIARLARGDDQGRGPWPGRLPAPSPARVLATPIGAMVTDHQGTPVGVSGRGVASGAPVDVTIDGVGRDAVVAWAGPWPADERWWDTQHHRRRARFQLLTASGAAYLASVESGRWWIEAVYE